MLDLRALVSKSPNPLKIQSLVERKCPNLSFDIPCATATVHRVVLKTGTVLEKFLSQRSDVFSNSKASLDQTIRVSKRQLFIFQVGKD